MTLKEKILKEFDENFCKSEKIDFASYGIKAMKQGEDNWIVAPKVKVRQFLSQSLDDYGNQISQEAYEAGLNLRKEYNDPELIRQIENKVRKETLSEVLKMLPKELKILKKHKGKSFCPQCENSGFNYCLEEIKETIEKEIKK